MQKILRRAVALFMGATLSAGIASADTYTTTGSGNLDDATTWGVDEKDFGFNENDKLIIDHEIVLATGRSAITVGNLQINPGGKLTIVYDPDRDGNVRSLIIRGDLINYGCFGFDRLGVFTNDADVSMAQGIGRLWVSLYGNLENHGVMNFNSLRMYGTNPTISATQPIQISDFSPKYVKGDLMALSDITFYNTGFSRWQGAVEASEFDALKMNGHTLTIKADAPKEPSSKGTSPGWMGYMEDMKVDLGDEGGKLVVNDAYIANNTFIGSTIRFASDNHAFILKSNVCYGDVDFAYGKIHVAANGWIQAFEVYGNVVNHTNLNSSEVVYAGMGYEKGTDYHMARVGNYGSALNGDFLVHGNFENLGEFGTADIYDTEYHAHTKLRMFTLGDDISIKGEMTAEVTFVQIHPNDEYKSTYNTYDGQILDKKGSISVKDFLKINRYGINVQTTIVVPEDATLTVNNDLAIAGTPIDLRNHDLNNERGIWNGLLKVRGSLIANWKEPYHDSMLNTQHFNFPEWSRWSFDGNEGFWQVRDYVERIEATECGKAVGEGFASRSWDIKVFGQPFNTCLHDLTLSYDDEDLGGLDENNLHVFQSLDGGKTWRQISDDAAIIREPENNKISVCRWNSPAEYWVSGFGLFTLGDPALCGIAAVLTDADATHGASYDLTGRKAAPDAKGIVFRNGRKELVK